MAKLTKRDRADLEVALRHAESAFAFISKDYIAVARKYAEPGRATTTLHYVRPDGSSLYEINKEYGSDLTGLENAVHTLRNFLATH